METIYTFPIKKLKQCNKNELIKILNHLKCHYNNQSTKKHLIVLIGKSPLYKPIGHYLNVVLLQNNTSHFYHQYYYESNIYGTEMKFVKCTNDSYIFSTYNDYKNIIYNLGCSNHVLYCKDRGYPGIIQDLTEVKKIFDFMEFKEMYIKVHFLNILSDLSIHFFKLYRGSYYIVI